MDDKQVSYVYRISSFNLQCNAHDAWACTGVSCRRLITFHSLEDRIVKTMFKQQSTVEQGPKNLPILPGQLESADFKLITRKPILPTEEEMQENSRSQSAKLRVIERVK